MIDVYVTKTFKHDGGFILDWEVTEVSVTNDHKAINIEKEGIKAVIKDCGKGWWLKFRHNDATITDLQYSAMIELLQALRCKYDTFCKDSQKYNSDEYKQEVSCFENMIGDTTFVSPVFEYIVKGITENEF